ncbi:MAG: hypothetical protein Q7J57_11050 [Gemmobacter sp.]|nr:hypothetical protein [Gemmobacter sp.]
MVGALLASVLACILSQAGAATADLMVFTVLLCSGAAFILWLATAQSRRSSGVEARPATTQSTVQFLQRVARRGLLARGLGVVSLALLPVAVLTLAFPGRMGAVPVVAALLVPVILGGIGLFGSASDRGWFLDAVVPDRLMLDQLSKANGWQSFGAGWRLSGRVAALRQAATLNPEAPEAARVLIMAQYAPNSVRVVADVLHKTLRDELRLRLKGWPVVLSSAAMAAALSVVLMLVLPPALWDRTFSGTGLSWQQPDARQAPQSAGPDLPEDPVSEEGARPPGPGAPGAAPGEGGGQTDAADAAAFSGGGSDPGDNEGGAGQQGAQGAGSEAGAGQDDGGAQHSGFDPSQGLGNDGASDPGAGTDDAGGGDGGAGAAGGGIAEEPASDSGAVEAAGSGNAGAGEEMADEGRGEASPDAGSAGQDAGDKAARPGETGTPSGGADGQASGPESPSDAMAGPETAEAAGSDREAGGSKDGAAGNPGSGSGEAPGADAADAATADDSGAGSSPTGPNRQGAKTGSTGADAASGGTPEGVPAASANDAAAGLDPAAAERTDLAPDQADGPDIFITDQSVDGEVPGGVSVPADAVPTGLGEAAQVAGAPDAATAPDMKVGSAAQLFAEGGAVPDTVIMALPQNRDEIAPEILQPTPPRQMLPAWINELVN